MFTFNKVSDNLIFSGYSTSIPNTVLTDQYKQLGCYLVNSCTTVRKITFQKACNKRITLNVT